MVACKVLMFDPENENEQKQIRKEITIHKNVNHPNIIQFYGNRRDKNTEFMFLEYASGGELFDRIEPDIGMNPNEAYRFFTQLLDGIQYLHQKGIVHRDIKPENLLIDSKDNLKISDFGFATLFRHRGQERALDQKCGSFPYMAPEVFSRLHHKAEPIDVWSCGIVLVTMLSGRLPWDKAVPELNMDYKKWALGKVMVSSDPWKRIDNVALSLLKCILEPTVSKRYTIKDIREHRYFNKNAVVREYTPDFRVIKRQCNGFHSQPTLKLRNKSSSQVYRLNSSVDDANEALDDFLSTPLHGFNTYSQPINIDDMFVSTQTQMEIMNSELENVENSSNNTQPGTRLYMRLVRRLTRFITKLNFAETMHSLSDTFKSFKSYNFKKSFQGQFAITTNDKNRHPLSFKVTVTENDKGKTLVDFRLSKGDGIEFKRQFLAIKNLLTPIIEQP